MDYMIGCPCGHTLEVHASTLGCAKCACSRDRAACLDAAIEAARAERSFYGPRPGTYAASDAGTRGSEEAP